eukprot:3808595-Rhodomonas_salina.2
MSLLEQSVDLVAASAPLAPGIAERRNSSSLPADRLCFRPRRSGCGQSRARARARCQRAAHVRTAPGAACVCGGAGADPSERVKPMQYGRYCDGVTIRPMKILQAPHAV